MTILLTSSLLLLFGLVVLQEDDYAFCLAIVVMVYLFSLYSPPAKGEPTLAQCEHTLAACDQLVQAQDAQVKLLKEEVKAWQAKASGPTPWMPLKWAGMASGALGGAVGGSVAGGRGETALGGLIGGITGFGLGWALEHLGY